MIAAKNSEQKSKISMSMVAKKVEVHLVSVCCFYLRVDFNKKKSDLMYIHILPIRITTNYSIPSPQLYSNNFSQADTIPLLSHFSYYKLMIRSKTGSRYGRLLCVAKMINVHVRKCSNLLYYVCK